MALPGKVVGGQYVNATININFKGELALTKQGFRRTPNLTADAVAAWEEIFPERRSGAAGAVARPRWRVPGMTAGRRQRAEKLGICDSTVPAGVVTFWADRGNASDRAANGP